MDKNINNNILILGGAGFIGSNLTEFLVKSYLTGNHCRKVKFNLERAVNLSQKFY